MLPDWELPRRQAVSYRTEGQTSHFARRTTLQPLFEDLQRRPVPVRSESDGKLNLQLVHLFFQLYFSWKTILIYF